WPTLCIGILVVSFASWRFNFGCDLLGASLPFRVCLTPAVRCPILEWCRPTNEHFKPFLPFPSFLIGIIKAVNHNHPWRHDCCYTTLTIDLTRERCWL